MRLNTKLKSKKLQLKDTLKNWKKPANKNKKSKSRMKEQDNQSMIIRRYWIKTESLKT